MSEARLIIGDSLAVTRTLEAGSVDLIVTSPPFLALRSYLPADHADKAKEMGSEATPGAFIDALLDLTEEWARVLAPHGSICVELGDTYSGSGGAGGDYNAEGLRDGQPKFRVSKPESSRPGRAENKHADRIAYETGGADLCRERVGMFLEVVKGMTAVGSLDCAERLPTGAMWASSRQPK
jgi:DNA modification methylase